MALFRVSFVVWMVIQTILVTLLLGLGLGLIWDHLPEGLLAAMILSMPLGVGALSYKEFQWLTCAEVVRVEAERRLSERRRTDQHQLKNRKKIKRWALWMPTVVVVITCVCIDGLWAVASHVLHPGRGKLVGYEVSIPLNWTIMYADLDRGENGGHSIVVADRFRGLIRAGSGLYFGRAPFSTSNSNFRSAPAGDPRATQPACPIISERSIPFGKGTIACWEEVPPRWDKSPRYIQCSTVTGDFSGNFTGSDEDASEFYRIIESTKKTR